MDPSDYLYEDQFTENLSILTENFTLNGHHHDAKCFGNGTLLPDIIESRNLKPLNFTDKSIGKWTRINTKKLSERSILDYVIIEEQFYEQINDMLIDEG